MPQTVVRFKHTHDYSPGNLVLPGRVPLNKLAEELNMHFTKVLHVPAFIHLMPTLRVRIIGTGPHAGDVTVALGPFAIEGHVFYEQSSPPPPEPVQEA
jgi:hypothetical protein